MDSRFLLDKICFKVAFLNAKFQKCVLFLTDPYNLTIDNSVDVYH